MADRGRTSHAWRAACGLVGPAAFTAAWLIGGWRQPRYPVVDEHISGLAALDAEHPLSMITGFVTLGACTVVFATELRRQLAAGGRRPGLGPVLLGLGGVAAVVQAVDDALGVPARSLSASVVPGPWRRPAGSGALGPPGRP